MSKPRIIKDYEKLSEELKQQIKIVYPRGYSSHLISFTNKDGEKKQGLPLETDDYVYLIRMTTKKAESIILEDEDFDDDGNLKSGVKKEYEDKFSDLDYLDANANDDNVFELPEEDDIDLD